MADLAELNLRIKSLEVKEATRRMREMEGASKRSERAADKHEKTSKRNANTTSKWARNTQSLVRQLLPLVSVLGAIGTVGRSINLAAQFETIQLAMVTLIGSEKEALQLLRDLEQFAATTPFQFQGLAATARLMLALGTNVEDVVPEMRILGDATAALGGNTVLLNRITLAIGQMRAKARVSGEEMRQLAEAGIPAWEFVAEALGVTIPEAMELSEKKAIDFDVAIQGIFAGMQRTSAGATQALASTTEGLFSTLKDNVDFALRDIGTTLIDAFDIQDKLRGMIDGTDDAAESMSQFVRIITGTVGETENLDGSLVRLSLTLQIITQTLGIWLAFRLVAVLAGWVSSIIATTSSVKALSLALKLSPLGLFATAATAVSFALISLTDGVGRSDEKLEQFNDTLDKFVQTSKNLENLQADRARAQETQNLERELQARRGMVAAIEQSATALRALIQEQGKLASAFEEIGQGADLFDTVANALDEAPLRDRLRSGARVSVDALYDIFREAKVQPDAIDTFVNTLTDELESAIRQNLEETEFFPRDFRRGSPGLQEPVRRDRRAARLELGLPETVETLPAEVGIRILNTLLDEMESRAGSTEAAMKELAAAEVEVGATEVVTAKQARAIAKAQEGIAGLIEGLREEAVVVGKNADERLRLEKVMEIQKLLDASEEKSLAKRAFLFLQVAAGVESIIEARKREAASEAAANIKGFIKDLEAEARALGVSAAERAKLQALAQAEALAAEGKIALLPEEIALITQLTARIESLNEAERERVRLRNIADRDLSTTLTEIRNNRLLLEAGEEELRLRRELIGASRDEKEIAEALAQIKLQGQLAGLSDQEISRRQDAAADEIAALQRLEQFKDVGEEIGRSVGSAFADVVFQVDSLSDALENLLKNVTRQLFDLFVTQQIVSAVGGAFPNLIESAKGNAFMGGAKVNYFADGGLIDSTAIFPLRNGNIGVAGEAGPEAAMKVQRLPGGDLGLALPKGAGGGSGTTINQKNFFSVRRESDFDFTEKQLKRRADRAKSRAN